MSGDPTVRASAGGGDAPRPPTVLPYARPAKTKSPDLYFPSKLRDLYVPALLLAAGIATGITVLMRGRPDHSGDSLLDALRHGSAYAVPKLLLLLACIPLVTRVAGVAFGTLPQAALKLSVVAILPDVLALVVMSWLGCTGMILAPVVGFVACWILFALLFEMDFIDSRFCAAVYWAIGMVFGGLWIGIFFYLL